MTDQKAAESEHWIVYPIGSKPEWPKAVLLGIQQYLTMFGATDLNSIYYRGSHRASW